MTRASSLVLCVLAIGLLATHATAGPIAHLTLQGQPGDYIAGDASYDLYFTPANSVYSMIPTLLFTNGQPTEVIFIVGDPRLNDDFSELFFDTNELGIPLEAGTYLDAQRSPFATAGHPGLSVSFDDRGLNMDTGNFTIQEITYAVIDGSLEVASFEASFYQIGDGDTGGLTGTFAYGLDSLPTPEPSTLFLLVAGLVPLVRRFRR